MMKEIIACGIAAAVGWASWQDDPQKIEYRYEVNDGDTVWTIAEKIAKPDEDMRVIVYDIIHDNNLKDAMITPGQELVIRVPISPR